VVPTVAYAVGAEKAGVDAIIAEGSESGGSTSLEEISTLVLIPQVVDAVRCPVIAAGGIGDGRGIAAVMALGAVGVQMGTRFMATEECEISRAFKELLVIARETDTRLVRYEKGARRIFEDTYFTKTGSTLQQDKPDIGSALDTDEGAELRGVGQVTGLITKIRPAGEIVKEMMEEAHAIQSSSAIILNK
jgi:enoyl-[acyl-carrier protein] reductase II